MKRYSIPEYKQVATPSNPAAGFNKTYLKSDNELYILDDDGTEHKAGAMTDTEIKTGYENNANTNVYTDAEKAKLAQIDDAHFKGVFVDEASLPATGDVGDYAYVDGGVGNDILEYIWDDDDDKYVKVSGSSTAETAASIKTKYESNADTNAYTDSEKTKLSGIEANATADQTDAEIKTAYENNADTNAFTDANKTFITNTKAGTLEVTDGVTQLDIRNESGVLQGIEAETYTRQGNLENTANGVAILGADGKLDNSLINAPVVETLIYTFVAGENITAGNPVYFNTADSRVYITDSEDIDKIYLIGFAKETKITGEDVDVIINGVISQTNLKAGDSYYLNNIQVLQTNGDGEVDQNDTLLGKDVGFGNVHKYQKQTFKIGYIINPQISISLRKESSPTGNMTLGLYDISNNLIDSVTLDVSTLTSSYADYTFNFTGTLDGGDYYIRAEYVGDSSNYIEWESDNVDTNYTNGTGYYKTTDADTWHEANVDHKFSIVNDIHLISNIPGKYTENIGVAITDSKLFLFKNNGESILKHEDIVISKVINDGTAEEVTATFTFNNKTVVKFDLDIGSNGGGAVHYNVKLIGKNIVMDLDMDSTATSTIQEHVVVLERGDYYFLLTEIGDNSNDDTFNAKIGYQI